MISNPCTFFINGDNRKKFTYEGGSTLFHFSPYDNGISATLDNNVIFFANDEAHAFDVLIRAFKFAIECKAKYIADKIDKKNVHWEEFLEQAEHESEKFSLYVKLLEEGKIKVTKAPTNQFYIVGWAANDTIH